MKSSLLTPLSLADRKAVQNGIDRNTVMKMTGLTEDDLAQIRH